MTTAVLQEDIGRVRVLRLNRPEAKNAFNHAMYVGLGTALREADQDSHVRVVVITGEHDFFSSGQDLGEMAEYGKTFGAGAPDGEVYDGEIAGFDVLLPALMEFGKPLIAAVNGSALGIGVTMLLHTDLNYIAAGAKLKCPFVPLGVVPEASSSYLLAQRIGAQRTAEFLFTGRWLSSSEAVAFGLAFQELPTDQLLSHTLDVAAQIARQPPQATRATKALLRAAEHDAVQAARARENRAFLTHMGSPENVEAITAFFEKRPPNFDDL